MTTSYFVSVLISFLTAKPRLIFDNGTKFPFFKRSISLNCYYNTISRRFLMTVFKSKYRNGIIGISVWYSFKNSLTIPATWQKKCSFAGKNRSFIASFITAKLFDDGCFDFGSFSRKVIIAVTFGQILSNRSAVTLFSTNLDQKYFK